jgi:enoyl-CoA hydratase/carnithine racemase
MAEPAGFSTIRYEALGAVARLTFDRSERANALDGLMLDEIGRALDAAERDDAIRAVIVTGAGSAFSSGFDLKEQMERRPSGVAEWRPLLRKDFDTVMRFWRFPKPTIAAVRGACLAGACELALACDLTIAADDAFFGEPELKFGAGIVVMILPWIVGPKLAKEIILLGEDRIPAARAREIGMVNRVVQPASSRPPPSPRRGTSRRLTPISSGKPSAPSTAASRLAAWPRRWRRPSTSTSGSRGRARPTRSPSWPSPAAKA